MEDILRRENSEASEPELLSEETIQENEELVKKLKRQKSLDSFEAKDTQIVCTVRSSGSKITCQLLIQKSSLMNFYLKL